MTERGPTNEIGAVADADLQVEDLEGGLLRIPPRERHCVLAVDRGVCAYDQRPLVGDVVGMNLIEVTARLVSAGDGIQLVVEQRAQVVCLVHHGGHGSLHPVIAIGYRSLMCDHAPAALSPL